MTSPGPGGALAVSGQLELTVTATLKQTDTLPLSDEDRAQLRHAHHHPATAAAHPPRPDRRIIGRVLKGIATVPRGLVLSVAGDYLTDLPATVRCALTASTPPMRRGDPWTSHRDSSVECCLKSYCLLSLAT